MQSEYSLTQHKLFFSYQYLYYSRASALKNLWYLSDERDFFTTNKYMQHFYIHSQ